jgi:predicted DsbA family dithiol-disulfide isomerase
MTMIKLDVYSDVVCPWCYIGKRHLDTALAEFRHGGSADTSVTWRPFQLNPQLPQKGMPRQTYVDTKFGGAQRAAAIYQRVSDAGRAAGIVFAFDKIVTQPNTLNAHRLIHYAQQSGAQEAMVTRLFEAYFLEGADLTDSETLSRIADAAGVPANEARAYLASDADTQSVRADDEQARAMGIQGVPMFVLNDRYAVSGAQPPNVLLQALQQAAQVAAA